MSAPGRVVFRVDESARTGFGHLARCHALAQALIEAGAQVTFCSRFLRPQTRALLQQQGSFVVELASEQAFLAQDWRDSVVVVDGYDFDEAFWQQLQAGSPLRTVHIDDLRPVRYVADVVVCYNEGVGPEQFQLAQGSRLFLGGRYLLLRPEILQAARTADRPVPRRLIVLAAGGTHQHEWVGRTLARLAPLRREQPHLRLRVLSGRRQPLGKVLPRSRLARGQARFASGLDASAMMRLYRRASCLVTPASTLMLEAFAAGCPIVSGWVADNQRNALEHYHRLGLIENVGDLRTVSREALLRACRRAAWAGGSMSRQQRAYIAASRSGLAELVQAILPPEAHA